MDSSGTAKVDCIYANANSDKNEFCNGCPNMTPKEPSQDGVSFKITNLRRREITTKSRIIGAPPKKELDGIELVLDVITENPITPEAESQIVSAVNTIVKSAKAFVVVPADALGIETPTDKPNQEELTLKKKLHAVKSKYEASVLLCEKLAKKCEELENQPSANAPAAYNSLLQKYNTVSRENKKLKKDMAERQEFINNLTGDKNPEEKEETDKTQE